MVVYRFEADCGKGIYMSGRIHEATHSSQIIEKHCKLKTPLEEPLLDHWIDQDEFCAFKSYADALKWVPLEFIEELAYVGLHFYKITLKEGYYRVGDHQVVFKKEGIISQTIIN